MTGQTHTQKNITSVVPVSDSFGSFLIFPAVAVLLGWGLRGYIGGGPFAAMIPGCFLALSLSMLLRHDRDTAVMTALFSTIAIGYGGEMTYGQTLGLACHPETMAWGFLGVTVKGAVWGLLGGAVLGAGLTWRQYQQKDILIALALTVIFLFVGWKLINEPKLIYFSDPVDRPREELWAGLLFAACAFLLYLRGKGSSSLGRMPVRFALWGAVGGGLGFGGGTLFLAFGPSLPVPQQWFGWWKAMEFFFGLMLGGAFGWCAWRYRDALRETCQEESRLPDTLWPALGLALLIAVYFVAFPVLEERLDAVENAGAMVVVLGNVFRPVYTFVFFGAVCIALGMRSFSAAWQVAVTATFFHTVVDLNRNWVRSNGFEAPFLVQAILMLALMTAMAVFTWRLQYRKDAVPRLYALILWSCYGMACMRTFLKKEYFFPTEEVPGGFLRIVTEHPGIIPVHAVFTVSAVITMLYIWRLRRQP